MHCMYLININMNKRLDTAIILILILILIGIGISSCAKPSVNTKSEPTNNILLYGGSIGKILGCMFAPGECDKLKKENPEFDSSDMTEEFEQLDKQIEEENK